MHAMVDALMKWETIDRDQLQDIMAGMPPREPKVYQEPVRVNFDKPNNPPSSGSGLTPPPLPAM